jgi:protein required for attachment to host cells
MDKTWILVADAASARIFEVEKPHQAWVLIEEFENPAGRAKSRDFLPSDEEGDIQHQEGAVFRSAMEPLSIKKVEAHRFAKQLAHALDLNISRNRFSRWLLVAPPEFLGMIREELSTGAKARLADEVAKDLAKSNPRELAGRLPIA